VLEGADGAVPGLANLVPALARQLIDAARAGDKDRVVVLQGKFDEVGEIEAIGFWLAALKETLSKMEICKRIVAPPLPYLTDSQSEMLTVRISRLMGDELTKLEGCRSDR
jgi:4-hydroxy-tetrahydrodipicolinate synthase